MTDQEFEELWEAMEVEAEIQQARIIGCLKGDKHGSYCDTYETGEEHKKV